LTPRIGEMISSSSRTLRVAGVILVLGLISIPAWGVLQEVSDRFVSTDYEGAGAQLELESEGARVAETLLWQSRLADQPGRALEFLEEARTKGNLPKTVQIRIALEIAALESARGRNHEALQALNQIFLEEDTELPGAFYLQAGLVYRAVGDLQRAREMLASIRPDDPVFAQGRGTLGEIGLQQNDPSLALRYFQSVPSDGPASNRCWPADYGPLSGAPANMPRPTSC
jgi:tetratricopeptide (TPR) repeat protein